MLWTVFHGHTPPSFPFIFISADSTTTFQWLLLPLSDIFLLLFTTCPTPNPSQFSHILYYYVASYYFVPGLLKSSPFCSFLFLFPPPLTPATGYPKWPILLTQLTQSHYYPCSDTSAVHYNVSNESRSHNGCQGSSRPAPASFSCVLCQFPLAYPLFPISPSSWCSSNPPPLSHPRPCYLQFPWPRTLLLLCPHPGFLSSRIFSSVSPFCKHST